MQGLIEGRQVHYVLADGKSKGQHRTATVVRVFDRETGLVNLHVNLDNSNDDPLAPFPAAHIVWKTSVHYSETAEAGTWHWIEKA